MCAVSFWERLGLVGWPLRRDYTLKGLYEHRDKAIPNPKRTNGDRQRLLGAAGLGDAEGAGKNGIA
jgi:hypothetical protein